LAWQEKEKRERERERERELRMKRVAGDAIGECVKLEMVSTCFERNLIEKVCDFNHASIMDSTTIPFLSPIHFVTILNPSASRIAGLGLT
jgi:hypothetical protein